MFTSVTFFTSLDAIRGFAGDDFSRRSKQLTTGELSSKDIDTTRQRPHGKIERRWRTEPAALDLAARRPVPERLRRGSTEEFALNAG